MARKGCTTVRSTRFLSTVLLSILPIIVGTLAAVLPARSQSPGKGELPWSRETSTDVTPVLWSVDALNADTVMAVGDAGMAAKTANQGMLWTTRLQADSTNNPLFGISYADSVNATAVGANGTIVRTTDGGAHWTRQVSGTNLVLCGVCFTGAQTGTAVGDSGTILRTTDGGATWLGQDAGDRSTLLLGVSFADSLDGIAVGASGKILHTGDGGAHWSAAASPVSNYLWGVSCISPGVATAVGTMGKILRTTDGGSTWAVQPSGTANYLYAVSFSTVSSGMAVGEGGTIVLTTDGGASWHARPSGTPRNLYGVAFFDTSRWFAVGGGGTIVRWGDGAAIVTGISPEKAGRFPAGFRLEQNYPNPFNPATSLSFQIPSPFSRAEGGAEGTSLPPVTLKVYDLLGREVATIVNGERLPPGSYTRIWDAGGLSSGVYFSRLEAGTFTETRKMILAR